MHGSNEEPPMPPSSAQLNVIRDSWERILTTPCTDATANTSQSSAFHHAFFEALFALDPALAHHFSNVQRQARALTLIVSYLARAPAVLPERFQCVKSLREMQHAQVPPLDDDEERWLRKQLQQLGARHARHHRFYEIHMLDHVGPALVTALHRRLDSEFSPAMRDAWLHSHTYVAYYMRRGFHAQMEIQSIIDDQTRGNCTIQ